MHDRRKIVSKEDFRKNPHADWNAFIDLLATSDCSDLASAQRPAHLIFMYESEVQNGGHLQYFVNRGPDGARETVAALKRLGAVVQADLLEQAIELWNSKRRLAPTNVEEYVEAALEHEFEKLDSMFYSAPAELTEVLQKHLSENEGLFIVRE